MPAPSLLQLAQKLCIKNIKGLSTVFEAFSEVLITSLAITDVGDAPYDRVRCVLLKLESPDQLVRTSVMCSSLYKNTLIEFL